MNQLKQQEPRLGSESPSYDATTIALHWVTAALVALLWLIAHYIDAFPKGPARINMRSTHIVLGALLGLVLMYRIYWRALRSNSLPLVRDGTIGVLIKSGHITLYALLVVAIALGISNAWIRGDNLFNQWSIPSLAPGNKALRKQIGDLHELAANCVLVAAGVHALLALGHHYFLGDSVLRRMTPRSR